MKSFVAMLVVSMSVIAASDIYAALRSCRQCVCEPAAAIITGNSVPRWKGATTEFSMTLAVEWAAFTVCS